MRALPIAALALLGFATTAVAQDPAAAPPAVVIADPVPAAPEAVHDELRKLRDDVLAAIQKNDFDAILPHLHPNVVFTPMNNEVCHGPQEVRAYFDKMLTGPGAIVKSVRFEVEVDRLTDLYGDVGLAYGSSSDYYALTNGTDFPVQTRWTCALVRENGKWLITAFQASANVFDNPVLDQMKKGAKIRWGGLGLAAGALVGLLLGVAFGRRRRA
jgi:ketosteroid isomerase-like protein